MNTELRTAIWTKLKTCTTNVYFDEAPKDQTGIYLVFKKIDGNNDYDSNEKYPKDLIQIGGFGNDLASLEVVENSVETVLDQQQATFSLTNYKVVEIIQRFSTQSKIDDTYYFIHHYFIDREHK